MSRILLLFRCNLGFTAEDQAKILAAEHTPGQENVSYANSFVLGRADVRKMGEKKERIFEPVSVELEPSKQQIPISLHSLIASSGCSESPSTTHVYRNSPA